MADYWQLEESTDRWELESEGGLWTLEESGGGGDPFPAGYYVRPFQNTLIRMVLLLGLYYGGYQN